MREFQSISESRAAQSVAQNETYNEEYAKGARKGHLSKEQKVPRAAAEPAFWFLSLMTHANNVEIFRVLAEGSHEEESSTR